jgi:hypothetical protein
MADDQKYFIRLHGKEIEVSEDVYYRPRVRPRAEPATPASTPSQNGWSAESAVPCTDGVPGLTGVRNELFGDVSAAWTTAQNTVTIPRP